LSDIAALTTIDDISPDELAEIIEAGKEAVELRKYFEFTPQGVIFHGDPPIEVWGKAIEKLLEATQSLPLLVGDMIAKGEDSYREKYAQYLPLGYAYGTLRNWAWVCRAVPIERRIEGLDFTHYCRVAPLPASEQTRYLKKAAKEGLSTNALERLVREKYTLPGPPPPPEVLLECLGKLVSTDTGWICELHTSNDLSLWSDKDVMVSITEAR